tara:strand:- start:130 stop:543 length:414 start_codon:yes stop_codon:yes gene_type:complete
MLSITAEVRDSMIAHAQREVPNEACGLFAGGKGTEIIETFFPMQNAAQSHLIYQLDPKEFIEVEQRADHLGIQILGVMHSHTVSEAYPSETDVRDASQFDPFGLWHYIIVSLQNEEPIMRSFRIIDANITEEEIEIK